MNARGLFPRAFALVWALASVVEPAYAHAPIKGVGVFYGYVLHPVLVPAHLMALAGSGLLLSQQTPAVRRAGVLMLMIAFACGLALAREAPPSLYPLFVGLAVGALGAWGRALPLSAVMIVCSLAGLAIGLDAAPEPPLGLAAAPAYAGLVFGVSWIVMIVQGYASPYGAGWPAIAKRVVASWIVATSALVLTVTLHPPVAHTRPAAVVLK